jgi:hypothetical protein
VVRCASVLTWRQESASLKLSSNEVCSKFGSRRHSEHKASNLTRHSSPAALVLQDNLPSVMHNLKQMTSARRP